MMPAFPASAKLNVSIQAIKILYQMNALSVTVLRGACFCQPATHKCIHALIHPIKKFDWTLPRDCP